MIMSSEEVELTQITNPQPPSSFSALPEEITENILARVSRWKYPSLSLVSKKFRSLLSSTKIYITRSQLKAEETCVYFCLRLHDQPYWRWFSLRAKPNQTLTKRREEISFKQDSSGNSVIPIPFPCPHITNQSTFTVGSEIYIIGGPSEEPSSSVWILDCRSHTWRNAPNMTVAREDACAYFDHEKIYVMGGCNIDEYSASWFEVFDMKTQSWTALPGPGPDDDELHILLRENSYSIVNVLEEKLYVMIKQKEYSYEPKNGTWKFVREQSSFLFDSVAAWCWIDNMIYCCTFSGDLVWSDSEDEGRKWRKIKGLRKLCEDSKMGLRTGSEFVMDNYGGKLIVMWDISDIKRKNKIGYAKISLEARCYGREIWGNAECVDELTFPCEAYESFNCISASV